MYKRQDPAITGTYGDVDFTDGTAVFTLRHGESKTVAGLPVDVTYEVAETEADQNGYTTAAVGASGTITEAGVAASFTNTKIGETPDPEPTETGNLTVSNAVSGNQADPNHVFSFKVMLNDTSLDGRCV